MPNYSQATIIGHAGKDAETRYLASGDAITSITIAVSRKRKDKENTTWWKVVVFGKPAEWAAEIQKGDVVFASGEPLIEEWVDKDGNKRSTLTLMAQSVVGHGKWHKKPEIADNPTAWKQGDKTAGDFSDMDDPIPF